MTTPSQPTSSSPSSSSSSSGLAAGSGAGAVIAKDTVTTGTSVSGLAGVLAEANAADVADKIVQAVSSHIPPNNGQGQIQEIRVIGDLSALNDITALRILGSQVTQLTGQITAYADSVPGAERSAAGDGWTATAFLALGVGAAITGLGTAASLISQLVTGTYTYSGQAIPSANVGGLDILVAQKLAAKTVVPVRVDRFAAIPADSEILAHLEDLVSQVTERLNPAIIRAASVAAEKAQIVADDKDRLTRLDAQLTAAQKASLTAARDVSSTAPDEKGSPPVPGKQQEEYDEVSNRLPPESGEAAAAQNHLGAGQALATAVNTFVTTAMGAPTAGGPAPVARAAHGEALSKDGTAILYAKVIAAGNEQVLRQTVIHNTWSNLTGLTVEYALIMPGGEAEAFGLEWAFAVTHGSMRKGLTDIARKPVPLHPG